MLLQEQILRAGRLHFLIRSTFTPLFKYKYNREIHWYRLKSRSERKFRTFFSYYYLRIFMCSVAGFRMGCSAAVQTSVSGRSFWSICQTRSAFIFYATLRMVSWFCDRFLLEEYFLFNFQPPTGIPLHFPTEHGNNQCWRLCMVTETETEYPALFSGHPCVSHACVQGPIQPRKFVIA